MLMALIKSLVSKTYRWTRLDKREKSGGICPVSELLFMWLLHMGGENTTLIFYPSFVRITKMKEIFKEKTDKMTSGQS